jgi:branched-chain amino acid transport system substrate-binding protein
MNDVQTHEAFRRENAVMGVVKDGKVYFAHDEDKKRLAAAGK